MKEIVYKEIDGGKPFYMMLGFFGIFVLAALGSAWYMEHNGHWVTGMNNQIVWGTPHVFAVFLIVTASGAINVASTSTVFGKVIYKPLARLSALLAICLLVGGLAILVLDLGRPDRLIVAMTYYNFKSIFAWNIFLYIGYIVAVAIYLWMMMEHKMYRFMKPVGFFAFFWRLVLTTGTGSIFGFLVARQAYDAAILAPMFIIMSFSFGLAFFILVLMGMYKWSDRPLGDTILFRLKNLLGIFIAAVLYFVIVYHLTNLYITEKHGVEQFILLDGGVYTQLFWIVQIGLGSLLPLVLLYHPSTGKSRGWIGIASLLVIIGGLAQVYVIIIGGQAYPLEMFPGKEVVSSFADGIVGSYTPSLPEIILGIGGIAVALAATLVGVRVLRFLPSSLADDQVDPLYSANQAEASA
jgi:Ni/Fe-hydrogenase subunit HybB-like protein